MPNEKLKKLFFLFKNDKSNYLHDDVFILACHI
jgi:hypothetical protein